MNLPLSARPINYKAYLDLLHERGARIYANTAMRFDTVDAGPLKEG